MRQIICSLFLFLLLSSVASAWEDTAEHYTTDPNEEWNIYEYDPDYNSGDRGLYSTVTGSEAADPRGTPQNTVLKLETAAWAKSGTYPHNVYGWAGTKDNITLDYISFILAGETEPAQIGNMYINLTKDTGETLVQFDAIAKTALNRDSKYEIIKTGSYFDLYLNGSLIQSKVNPAPSYTGLGKFWICSHTYTGYSASALTHTLYLDDFTTSSVIGIAESFTESNTNLSITWNAQLIRSYSSQFKVSLYSLTNQDNTGLISSWNIPQDDNTLTAEHGAITINRNSLLGLNYGLYMLEMTRDDEILTNAYCYYDQLANPQGFPEILFLGESDVNTEIRDEDSNGGEITEEGQHIFILKLMQTGYII